MTIRTCYQIIGCPPDMRNECPAYRRRKNCWEYMEQPKLCCKVVNATKCRDCGNYAQHLLDVDARRRAVRVSDRIRRGGEYETIGLLGGLFWWAVAGLVVIIVILLIILLRR